MVSMTGTPLELVAHEADRRSDPPKKTRPWVTGLLWKATTAILGVVVALASLWTWWVPHYRPPLAADERFGIDVSNHQGDIDWQRVAHDDIHFAYI